MDFRIPLLALLFALAIALATVPKARKLQSPDFKVFYVAAQHALENPAQIYTVSPDRYLYPPSTALLLTPFAFSKNFSLHQWVWHGLLGVLVALLAGRSLGALLAMVLLSRYLAITFGYGQINLVVLALLNATGAWLHTFPGRAGALWALATSLKIYPAVLAPVFLREKKGILPAIALGVFLLLLPFLFFGSAMAWQLYGDFFRALQEKGLPTHSHNQSFTALLLRLFTDELFYLHAVGPTSWTITSLPVPLIRGLALLLGGTLTFYTWREAFRKKDKDFLSAAAFTILFLSHIIWKDYLLLLFFPLREYFTHSCRKASLQLAVPFVALVLFSSPDLWGANVSTRLDAACIHLWAAVLVWIHWMRR